MTIDEDARSVSVPAAMRYGNLARQLHEAGWALSNLPSYRTLRWPARWLPQRMDRAMPTNHWLRQ